MAGLGRKVFEANEVLTAADVNGYLMDQSVQRFASAAARDTAIPTPSEGMVCYLDDVNQIELYNGTDWVDQQSPLLSEGTAGQYLQSNGASGSQWVTSPSPDDLITTQGDLIIGDASGDAVRLPVGAADTVLTSDGTTLSFAAAGGGADDFTLISSGAVPTGATSATFTGLSGYTDYIIDFTFGRAGSGGIHQIRINANSDFDGVEMNFQDKNLLNFAVRRTGSSNLQIGSGVGTNAVAGCIQITGANTTGRCGVIYTGGATSGVEGHRQVINSGTLGKSDLELDSFTLFAPGNITSGGSYRVIAR